MPPRACREPNPDIRKPTSCRTAGRQDSAALAWLPKFWRARCFHLIEIPLDFFRAAACRHIRVIALATESPALKGGPDASAAAAGLPPRLAAFWPLLAFRLSADMGLSSDAACLSGISFERRHRREQDDVAGVPIAVPQSELPVAWVFEVPVISSGNQCPTLVGGVGALVPAEEKGTAGPDCSSDPDLSPGRTGVPVAKGFRTPELAFAARILALTSAANADQPAAVVQDSRVAQGSAQACPQEECRQALDGAVARNDATKENRVGMIALKAAPRTWGETGNGDREAMRDPKGDASAPWVSQLVQDRPERAVPRRSEPAAAEAFQPDPPARAPDSRGLAVRLDDGRRSVDLRLADRAGEIRVTAHTADRDLAASLRSELPDLVGRLRQSGFHAEAWRPPAVAASPDTEGGRNTRGFAGSPEQQPGHGPGDHRQRQDQRKQQRWAGEWHAIFGPA